MQGAPRAPGPLPPRGHTRKQRSHQNATTLALIWDVSLRPGGTSVCRLYPPPLRHPPSPLGPKHFCLRVISDESGPFLGREQSSPCKPGCGQQFRRRSPRRGSVAISRAACSASKSLTFGCPSSTPPEVIWLHRQLWAVQPHSGCPLSCAHVQPPADGPRPDPPDRVSRSVLASCLLGLRQQHCLPCLLPTYKLLFYCIKNTEVPSGRGPGTADIPPRACLGASKVLDQIPSSICIKSVPAVASEPPSGMFSAGASAHGIGYRSLIPETLG